MTRAIHYRLPARNLPIISRSVGIVAAALFLFLGLHSQSIWAADTDKVPVVAVSIVPQAEFVTRIAGNRVKVMVLVGPGSSPHNYEPSPRQMAELATAKLWLSIGVDFERGLMPKISKLYPRLAIVDTTRDVVFRSMVEHDHEEEGDHEEDENDKNEGRDQHVWLGHDSVKAQLAVILESLIVLKPEDEALFRAHYALYLADIDKAFSALKSELGFLKGRHVFVYHPSFGYFFESFGIIQIAVEVGGKEPTQKTIALLIAKAREYKAKHIFVQKQFSSASARTIAKAIGGSVVEIDPLEARWLDNISAMGQALKRVSP
jgi:zinc transport system substrate-binding protein